MLYRAVLWLSLAGLIIAVGWKVTHACGLNLVFERACYADQPLKERGLYQEVPNTRTLISQHVALVERFGLKRECAEIEDPVLELFESCEVGKLKGDWESYTGVVLKGSNEPLKFLYRFDGQGGGEFKVEFEDNGLVCDSTASANFDDNCRLNIEIEPTVCGPGKPSVSSFKLQCEMEVSSGEVVSCLATNVDGSTFDVGFHAR